MTSIPKWIQASLSEEQLRPFERQSHSACIVAAAGSGKTRTLTHLVSADLANGMSPSSIVVFTFTEKAAEELLARIHTLRIRHFPEANLGGMFIGTIHAWCLDYLLKQSDFYNISSVDELHLDALVSRLYDALQIERSYGIGYPKGIPDFLADIEIFYNEHLPMSAVPLSIRPSIELFIKVPGTIA